MKRSSHFLEELGAMSLLDYALILFAVAGIALVAGFAIYFFTTGSAP